jgi:hypothetical protein
MPQQHDRTGQLVTHRVAQTCPSDRIRWHWTEHFRLIHHEASQVTALPSRTAVYASLPSSWHCCTSRRSRLKHRLVYHYRVSRSSRLVLFFFFLGIFSCFQPVIKHRPVGDALLLQCEIASRRELKKRGQDGRPQVQPLLFSPLRRRSFDGITHEMVQDLMHASPPSRGM